MPSAIAFCRSEVALAAASSDTLRKNSSVSLQTVADNRARSLCAIANQNALCAQVYNGLCWVCALCHFSASGMRLFLQLLSLRNPFVFVFAAALPCHSMHTGCFPKAGAVENLPGAPSTKVPCMPQRRPILSLHIDYKPNFVLLITILRFSTRIMAVSHSPPYDP